MVRRLTYIEVITRIAIKVMLDARPGMTRRQLVAFFHVSTRTVTDASRHSPAYWASVLASTPVPRKYVRPGQAKQALQRRPGDRAKVRLVEAEPTIEYTEVVDFEEIEPSFDEEANDKKYAEEDERLDKQLRGVK